MLKKFIGTLKDKSNRYIIFIIVFGSITLSLPLVKSGLCWGSNCRGLGYWGPNGHDGVWHLALIKSLARGSWEMPTFSGVELKNYHVGYDLLVAIFHKITLIPVSILYFQILPVLMSVMLGVGVSLLVYELTSSKKSVFWSIFFVYFGGSLGWIVTLLRDGMLGGETMFWAQQSVSTMINPPFSLSLITITFALLLLIKGLSSKNKSTLAFSTFLFGLTSMIKIYAGVLLLAGLFVSGIYFIFEKRKFAIFKVFSGSLLISIITIFPVLDLSKGSLEWYPFWFLETMMGISDRVGWTRFYEAMINYKTGGVWIKAVLAYFFAFVAYSLGNMGLRLFGLLSITKNKKNNWFSLFSATIIFFGTLIPMFFVQSGTPWNTIQFFYYAIFFTGIFAGLYISNLTDRLSFRLSNAISFGIIFVTLPTTFSTLYYHYLPPRPPAFLPSDEIEALSFLQKREMGVVLTYPYNSIKAQEAESNPPRPLYLYESTAYVSAYSDKPVYLEDQVNLDITGYDWRSRRDEVEKFLQSNDIDFVRNFLRKNNIKYIYWLNGQRALLGEEQLGIVNIFENKSVKVYEVIEPDVIDFAFRIKN